MNTSHLINVHPQLIPYPIDRDPQVGVWKRVNLMRRHSILHGEAVRESLLLHALQSVPAQERRRVLHAYFQDRFDLQAANLDRNLVWMNQALENAHGAIRHLIADYLPLLDRKNLEMISDVATERDPIRLIELAAEAAKVSSKNPEDVVSRRIAFEGRRQLHIALLEFEAMHLELSREDLSDAMNRFVAKLEETCFEKNRSERLFLESDHDPADNYRVKGSPTIRHNGDASRETPPGLVRYAFPLDVRMIQVGKSKSVRMFFDTRIKEHHSLKLIRDGKVDPRALHDLYGAKFVFFSYAELREAVRAIRQRVVRIPGMVFGEASNLQRSGVLDGANQASANEYRVLKFNVQLFGRYFELQFMLLSDWLNEWASYGRENHDFYKIRAYLKELFPYMWPQEVYGTDWQDSALEKRLQERVYSRIGWRRS